MQRINPAMDAAITELVQEFAGIHGVTQTRVIIAALRLMLVYIKHWRGQGQSMERIWRDLTSGR